MKPPLTRFTLLRRALDQPASAVSPMTLPLRVIALAREKGELTGADFRELGSSTQYAAQLVRRGLLRRIRHGVYGLPEHEVR